MSKKKGADCENVRKQGKITKECKMNESERRDDSEKVKPIKKDITKPCSDEQQQARVRKNGIRSTMVYSPRKLYREGS